MTMFHATGEAKDWNFLNALPRWVRAATFFVIACSFAATNSVRKSAGRDDA
jgi:hypothetical protein